MSICILSASIELEKKWRLLREGLFNFWDQSYEQIKSIQSNISISI